MRKLNNLVEIIQGTEMGRQYDCRPILMDQFGYCLLHNMCVYRTARHMYEFNFGKLVGFMPGQVRLVSLGLPATSRSLARY
jgi:hypothetical protein